MRLLRYAVVAALTAIPVLVAASPAAYAATSRAGSRAAGLGGAGGSGGAGGLSRAGGSDVAGGLSGAGGASGGSTAFATPSTVSPGDRVTFTADCSPAAGTGSATLFGATLGLPSRIPMDEQDGNSFDFTISVDLPIDIAPGTYHPNIDCPGATSASPTLHVRHFPSGAAATGDGTTTATADSPLALAGLALVAAGALAGGFALRRRGAHPRG